MIESILDTNVLVDFASIDAIELLAGFFSGRASVVAHAREAELGKGALKGLPDPCVLKGELWVRVIDDMDIEEYHFAQELVLRLGEQNTGEAHAIALCRFRSLEFCTRDTDAMRIAAHVGVTVFTPTAILNRMIHEEHLTIEQAFAMAERLTKRGAVNPRYLFEKA